MEFVINHRTDAGKTNVNLLIGTTPYKCPAHTINSLLTPCSLIIMIMKKISMHPTMAMAFLVLTDNSTYLPQKEFAIDNMGPHFRI